MVGERLAEIRKDHNDTQAVLAKKLNVSVTTVRSWEQEKSSPSHDALVAICRLYRISADYLLGLSEVDPAYDPRGNQQRFTDDEWAALREYEEFLLWKRRKKARFPVSILYPSMPVVSYYPIGAGMSCWISRTRRMRKVRLFIMRLSGEERNRPASPDRIL